MEPGPGEAGRGEPGAAGGSRDGGPLTARMRDGISRAVRSGGQLSGLAPSALVSFLLAAAFAPFLMPLIGHTLGGLADAELGAALNQIGAMGGGYLTDVLTQATDRMRRDSRGGDSRGRNSAARELLARDVLATAIREALEAPGDPGARLRASSSEVLRELDAVQVAMAADRDNILVPGFAALGEGVAEFRWVLGDVQARLAELRQLLARQGAQQRGQMHSARVSLDAITVLLQRVLAAQEQDREAAGTPGRRAGGPDDGPAACPYPGMRPFESRDASRFFGREDLTAHLVGRLAEQAGAGAALVVLGASGAGKSSLLRAGLIPALRRGLLPAPGSSRWPRVLVGRPGAHPLGTLTRAMTGPGNRGPVPALDDDPMAVAQVLVARALATRGRDAGGTGGPQLVLVVDQFEEAFTQCADEAERLQFIRVLLALARPGGGPGQAIVVLGLRADFYQDCANVAELAPLLPDNQVVVGPLAEPDLRRAISMPAAAAGVAVEPGLTELLLADLGVGPGRAGYEPGALPLLGYALQATWSRRAGRTLTLAAYREAGEIHGAVANEAEQIFAGLPPSTQAMTRRVLLRLVTVGPDVQQTRRSLPRDDLLAGLDAAAAETALARFTQARLITADASGVEITHEAFLGAWPRLRNWIAEDRAGLRLHRQIGADARSWAGEDEDPGGLYRGARLANAQQWRLASGNETELAALEREFLDASAAAEQAGKAAQERERLRDRRQNRRLRVLAAGLTVVLVAALAVTRFALLQRQHAQMQRDVALSEADAARSDDALTTNLRSADLYALAGWQAGHTADARGSLLSREADPYLGSFPEPAQAPITALAVSRGSRLLAVGEQPSVTDSREAVIQLWDLATRREVAVFRALGGSAQTLAFSPDGAVLAAVVAGTVRGNLRFWDVATHRALADPIGPAGVVSALAYSPGGTMLAVARLIPRPGPPGRLLADAGAEVDLWDLGRHRLVRRLTGMTGMIGSLAFSPGGGLLASGGYGTTRLWNVAAGTRRAALRHQGGIVLSVSFSRDGRRLVSASTDGSDWVWTVATASLYARISSRPTTRGVATPAAFSPGDQYLSVGELADGINRYNLATLTMAAPPMGIQGPVGWLAASPDGRVLVAAGIDGSLFALGPGLHTFYQADASPLSVPAVSPDGRTVAVGAADGAVERWRTSDPAAARVLATAGAGVMDTVFSRDGTRLATVSDDCVADVWAAATGQRLASLTAPGDYADDLATARIAFSPGGRELATDCTGGPPGGPVVTTAMVWNATTFRLIASMRMPVRGVTATSDLAFAPDGRSIAVPDGAGSILLWDTGSGRVTGRIPTREPVSALAFSPDGRTLATAGGDKTIRLWDIARRRQVAVLPPGTSQVRELAFSPDGRLLAAAAQDATVRLWAVRGYQPLAALSVTTPEIPVHGTPMEVNGVAFGPGGRTLVSANSDGTAQEWDLNPGDAVRSVCAALRGPALAREWAAVSSAPDPCLAVTR